jgi:thiamine-phosphate pyrophosphorylase
VTRRQTPEQWLIITAPLEAKQRQAVRRLTRGNGVLVIGKLGGSEVRYLRCVARSRDLMMVIEAGRAAARVHGLRELTRAMLQRRRLVFLSPLYRTHSHPDWLPLPRMRAAALASLGRRKLFALGGMDAKRYAKVARLGFIGWAGISAFRT